MRWIALSCAALLASFAPASGQSGSGSTEPVPFGPLPAELFDPGRPTAPGNGSPAAPSPGAAEANPAQAAARREMKARRVLALALPKERLADMLSSIRPELEQQLKEEARKRGKKLTPALTEQLVKAMRAELDTLYGAMLPQMPPIYAGVFTEAELDKLIELYSSPEGRSMLNKLDLLSVELSKVMDPYIAVYRNRLRERVKKVLEPLD